MVTHCWVTALSKQYLFKCALCLKRALVPLFPLLFISFFWWHCGLNQVFVLARQVFYHLSHASSPFCSVYFGDRVLLLCPGQPRLWSSYLCPWSSWDDRCMPPSLVIDCNGILLTFCLNWPRTTALSISTSVRTIGMNRQHLAMCCVNNKQYK
jgi:hypothetical protein